MKVLIIEDEHHASQKLIRLLQNMDMQFEIAEVLKSVEGSINWFLKNPEPDLIFVDIQLEDGLSFEIFEQCPVKAPVIFTTAYDEYALKAFKVNSVDYLLKPICPDDLKNAVNKFSQLHQLDYSRLASLIRQMQPTRKERFLIKIGEHYKSIPVNSIHCFYILERCTFLTTCTRKHYPVEYSLEQVEQMIDPALFFRVNRNYIINYNAIQDMIAYSSSRLKVILANPMEEEIIVSRERVSGFKKWMDR